VTTQLQLIIIIIIIIIIYLFIYLMDKLKYIRVFAESIRNTNYVIDLLFIYYYAEMQFSKYSKIRNV